MADTLFNDYCLSNGAQHLYIFLLDQKCNIDCYGIFVLLDKLAMYRFVKTDKEHLCQWIQELEKNNLVQISREQGRLIKVYFKPLDIRILNTGFNVTEQIKENISYEILLSEGANDGQINELVDIIADIISIRRKIIKISGVDYPYEFVCNKLMKLRIEHIRYVLYCLENNAKKINKMRPYLLACLFNATDTITNFYKNEIKHIDSEIDNSMEQQ